MQAQDARGVRVVDALAEGLGGIPRAWRRAWGSLLPATVLAAAVAVGQGAAPVGVALKIALAIAALAAWGAVSRITLFGSAALTHGLGPAGLQLGRGEAALAAATALNLIFLGMIAAVVALVALAVAGASEVDPEALRAGAWASAGPAWRLIVVGVVLAGAVGTVTVLLVRLSLYAPASVAEGRPVSLGAMSLAAGRFWPLLALSGAVVLPLAGGVWAGGAGRTAAVLGAVGLAGLWLPFAAGALAAAHRKIVHATPGEGGS